MEACDGRLSLPHNLVVLRSRSCAHKGHHARHKCSLLPHVQCQPKITAQPQQCGPNKLAPSCGSPVRHHTESKLDLWIDKSCGISGINKGQKFGKLMKLWSYGEGNRQGNSANDISQSKIGVSERVPGETVGELQVAEIGSKSQTDA